MRGPSKQAIALYEGFHKESPKQVGKFPSSFRVPKEVVLLGEADYVLYRSRKRDPLTHQKPKRPIDYIHEHEGGVKVYVADLRRSGPVRRVPQFIQEASSLVRLGHCLGYGYSDEEEVTEVDALSPYPELYAIPSGKALLAIQSKRRVLALIWGGRLGVEPRGIVY